MSRDLRAGSWIARIEVGFAALARRIVRRPWPVIVLSLALLAALGSQLPKLQIDSSVEVFLQEDDPVRMRFDAFRAQFGRSDAILLAVEADDVFALDFLQRLRRLHRDLEAEVPHLEEVTSLINTRATRGEDDELIVEDLMEDFPESQQEADGLRARAFATPLYLNTVISEDGRFTSLVIDLQLYADDEGEASGANPGLALGGGDTNDEARGERAQAFLSGSQIDESLAAIRAVMARHRQAGFELAMAGSPVLNSRLTGTMQEDMRVFIALMLAMVAGMLLALFRRLSGVLLPLTVVVFALISTFGAMAWMGRTLSAPTQILPTFLLAVGTGAAVHILKIFYQRYDAGDSVEDALAHTYEHSALPVVMTGLTTAGGLLSFLATSLQPIFDLGTFAPIGIMLALSFALVLLPALASLLPIRRRMHEDGAAHVPGRLERAIVSGGDFSATHPWWMVALMVALLVFSLQGALRLGFANDVLGWLPQDDPVVADTHLIDRALRGSITLEVVADTGRENGVQDPIFLAKLDELARRVQGMQLIDGLSVGKTVAVTDVLQEIHQALNENRPEFHVLPESRELIAQELLLFESSGADDLEEMVDSTFSLARLSVRVPYADPLIYSAFIRELEGVLEASLGELARVHTTGFMGMMSQTIDYVIEGMARSYVLALLIITPLMILLIGSLRGGLVSMVPNLTPILLTLGMMGWLGVKIDMFTMMIGGIAIGLAIDDTIHFVHGFRRYLERTGDPRLAVRRTLETTGQALLVTSLVLASGFVVFAFSRMIVLAWFGLLTSFTIAMAFIIDILITPALLVLLARREASTGGAVTAPALESAGTGGA